MRQLIALLTTLLFCTTTVVIRGDRTEVCVTCCERGNCIVICDGGRHG